MDELMMYFGYFVLATIIIVLLGALVIWARDVQRRKEYYAALKDMETKLTKLETEKYWFEKGSKAEAAWSYMCKAASVGMTVEIRDEVKRLFND